MRRLLKVRRPTQSGSRIPNDLACEIEDAAVIATVSRVTQNKYLCLITLELFGNVFSDLPSEEQDTARI